MANDGGLQSDACIPQRQRQFIHTILGIAAQLYLDADRILHLRPRSGTLAEIGSEFRNPAFAHRLAPGIQLPRAACPEAAAQR